MNPQRHEKTAHLKTNLQPCEKWQIEKQTKVLVKKGRYNGVLYNSITSDDLEQIFICPLIKHLQLLFCMEVMLPMLENSNFCLIPRCKC